MFLTKIIPVKSKLLTWEKSCTFEGVILETSLKKDFEREFPNTYRHIVENNENFGIFHLVTFNASEGKISRFMVVKSAKIKQRILPEKCFIYGIADEFMRRFEGDNQGNFWFYFLENDLLFLMVFFEGRLCHISEEILAENLETRLNSFRNFLKTDALFSRAKKFEEVCLKPEDYSESKRLFYFKKACRDTLWKTVAIKSKGDNKKFYGPKKYLGALLILAALLWFKPAEKLECKNCKDAVPISLLPYPELIEMADNPFEDGEIEKNKVLKLSKNLEDDFCQMPNFRIKGVVGNVLAMIEMNGVIKAFNVADSLEHFRIKTVGNHQVTFECGSLLVEKQVER